MVNGQRVACSRLRDSRIHWSADMEKKTGRKLGRGRAPRQLFAYLSLLRFPHFLKALKKELDHSMNQHSVSYKNLYSWTPPQRPLWGQKKVAVVEKFKQESIYGLSAEKNWLLWRGGRRGGFDCSWKESYFQIPFISAQISTLPVDSWREKDKVRTHEIFDQGQRYSGSFVNHH